MSETSHLQDCYGRKCWRKSSKTPKANSLALPNASPGSGGPLSASQNQKMLMCLEIDMFIFQLLPVAINEAKHASIDIPPKFIQRDLRQIDADQEL